MSEVQNVLPEILNIEEIVKEAIKKKYGIEIGGFYTKASKYCNHYVSKKDGKVYITLLS